MSSALMKFVDFLKEDLSQSIDDNDVINTLSNYGIYYDRVKSDNNKLLYKFDNRYSISYDGEVFTLYRHENVIHRSNARNITEIDAAIAEWNNSYDLASTEVTDENLEDVIDKMKKDAGLDDTDEEILDSDEEVDAEDTEDEDGAEGQDEEDSENNEDQVSDEPKEDEDESDEDKQ